MSSNSAPLPMLRPTGVHHVAVIASDYARSRRFYTEVLGLQVVHEHYRAERQSYKLDLQLPDGTQVELFSFPNPPPRPSYPEACGLRHLALRVADMQASVAALAANGVAVEPVRTDPFTGALFTFFADPDGLPIELVAEGRARCPHIAATPQQHGVAIAQAQRVQTCPPGCSPISTTP